MEASLLFVELIVALAALASDWSRLEACAFAICEDRLEI
jgi:hypothetical protein